MSVRSSPQTLSLPMSPGRLSRQMGVVLIIALCVVLAVTTKGFLTVANFKAILASVSTIGIVAIGMTVVIIGGSLFSLSLAATLAVSAMGFLASLKFGIAPAILIALAIGGVTGVLQGLLVGLAGANPIIVTIGAASLIEGIGVGVSHSNAVMPDPSSNYQWLTQTIGGIPFSVFVLFGLAVVVELALRYTRFGRELYLIGDNRPAAHTAGLPVINNTVAAFVVAGICAAIAGILLGASDGQATLQIEGTVSFDAFAAVLVGGTSLSGGTGSVARTILGALIIAVITDALLLRGYSTGVQVFAKGVIVLIVIVLMKVSERSGA